MTAQEMWNCFHLCEKISADWTAWAFAGSDTLAELTLRGIKTATSSAYESYEAEGEKLPEAGEYSVILNSREEAVCIIRTEKVAICPFDEVSEDHAWKEGEGDRSLSYWREVHETFFRQELSQIGETFDPKMAVVCEEFVRVFP